MNFWLVIVPYILFLLFLSGLSERSPRLRRVAFTLHALLWVAVMIYAYQAAGSYQIFNCWGLVFMLPSVSLLVAFLFLASFISLLKYHTIRNKWFFMPLHFLFGVAGLVLATISALLGTEQFASCL